MTNIKQIFEYLMRTMDNLLLLIIGIALLAFVWGVFRYLKSYDNEKERSASVSYMTYGLISLLVIISLWGFVNLIASTIGVKINNSNNNINNSNGNFNQSITDESSSGGVNDGGFMDSLKNTANGINDSNNDVPEVDITKALEPDPDQFFNNLSQ
jgi:predicted PurR-regulated permease PerM